MRARFAADPARAPRAAQEALAGGLLLAQLRHTLRRSAFYRARFGRGRLPATPAEARAVLADLPPTTRADLESRGAEFRCCRPEAVRDVVSTSGTTGAPIALWLTARDLRRLAACEARSFRAAGLGPGDTVQVCVTLDSLFMAGLAYWLGLQEAGCAAVRQGAGNPARQLELLRQHGATGIVTVPSFLLAIAREAARQGLAPEALPLRAAVLVGENLRDAELGPCEVARQLGALWPRVGLFGNYGNSEMCGSFCECEAGRGAHLHPDLAWVEILDERGRSCAPGKPGELVVTTLQVEGTPLLRYRTGDLTFLVDAPCSCGRRTPRLGPVLAREGQMLKVRGTKVYPPAVVDAARGCPEFGEFVVVAERGEDGSDRLVLLAAPPPGAAPAPAAARAAEARLADRLRVRPEVRWTPREEIAALAQPPGYRKRRSFVDRR